MAVGDLTIIDAWLRANKTQPVGKEPEGEERLSKSRLFFKGNTLYSYRSDYPIATLRHTTMYDVNGQRYERTAYMHPAAEPWSRAPRGDPAAAASRTTASHISLAINKVDRAGYYPLPVLTLPGNIGASHVWLGALRFHDECVLTVGRIQHWCEKALRAREKAYFDYHLRQARAALHHLRLVHWVMGDAAAPSTPLSLNNPHPDAVIENMREQLWLAKVRREMAA